MRRLLIALSVVAMTACEGVPDIGEPAADPEPQPTPPEEPADDAPEDIEQEPEEAVDIDEGTALGIEHEFEEGRHRWQDAGLTLDVLAMRISSREQVMDVADIEWALDDDTHSVLAMKVRVSNGTDRTINWYVGQATIQVGSEQREAHLFLSDSVGGSDMLAGTVDEGTVIWEFRSGADELESIGEARLVTSRVSDDDFEAVSEGVDMTFNWP